MDRKAFDFTGKEPISSIDNVPVTVISRRAFKEKNLEYIRLHEGITDLEEESFSKNKLREIDIPASVRTLGTAAFYKNPIRLLVLHNGVKTIGDFCFYGCQLEELNLPPSLEKIGILAFGENPIKMVSIGSNVILDSTDSISSVYPGFNEAYEASGRMAGRYVFGEGRWEMGEG
jgi:hypothetical protein